MNETYSDEFIKSLKKFSSNKKRILNKIKQILQHPMRGEPLKYDLRGLYSVSAAKNIVIIYSYCSVCRKKEDDKILLCHDCNLMSDETLRFFDVGPHDIVYGINSDLNTLTGSTGLTG